LSELFEAVLHDYRADVLLLPAAGPDQKDMVVCKAGLAAARAGKRCTGQWTVPQVMGYEQTVLSLEFGPVPSFSAFINISDQINVKLEALTLYKSKSVSLSSVRSVDAVRALARLRGAQIDVP
jgi:hypothetical protein